MKLICTYFDSNFLARGLALINSLSPDNKMEIAVLALDNGVRQALRDLNRKDIIIVDISDFKGRISAFKSGKEFFFSLSADLCEYCRAVLRPDSDLLYVDADVKFFRKASVVFEICRGAAVAFTSHRHHPLLVQRYAKYGKFNVGINFFSASSEGTSAIKLWKERCDRSIKDKTYPTGLNFFSDQVVLDDYPDLFPNFYEITEIGVNAAPWNAARYNFQIDNNGRILVNGLPLICFHFSNLKYLGRGVWDCSDSGAFFYMSGALKEIYTEYISEISAKETPVVLAQSKRSVKLLVMRFLKSLLGLYMRTT